MYKGVKGESESESESESTILGLVTMARAGEFVEVSTVDPFPLVVSGVGSRWAKAEG